MQRNTPPRLLLGPKDNEYRSLDYYTPEEIEYIKNNKKEFLKSRLFASDFDVLDLVIDEENINEVDGFEFRVEDGFGFYYSTPLTAAIYFEREDLINYLLLHGADPNLISEKRMEARNGGDRIYVPLLSAIKIGNIGIVQRLLDAGASIENTSLYSKYHKDYTMYPLTYALLLGNFDIAYLLITYGANLNYVDVRGLNYRQPVYGLLNYYAKMTLPYGRHQEYIKRTPEEALVEIERILQNGLNVANSKYPIIAVILDYIKQYQITNFPGMFIELLKLLLEYGADPNIEKGRYYHKYSSVTTLLILYGYRFDDSEINDIVSQAQKLGHTDIVNYFTNDIKLPSNCR